MRLQFNSAAKGVIPGNSNRRKLWVRNTGTTTIYWGYELATSATGDTQGFPLAPGTTQPFGEGYVIDGNDKIQRPIYFATETTGIVNYTEEA